MNYQDTFFENTTPQECWVHAGHIIADYLLLPDLLLLFDNKALDPIYWHNYKQIKDASNAEQDRTKREHLIRERNNIANAFQKEFALLLVEFFQLRLLGSQKDINNYLDRFDKYLELFLNLIGEGDEKTPMLTLTYQFVDMLKDYILRNCPALPLEAQNLNTYELMQEVRRLYANCEQNPRYTNFENNSYTAGILNLLDKIGSVK